MRQIVCKFADERQFFHHLRRSSFRARKHDALCFLGDFDALPGEHVRVCVQVANCNQRYELNMTITTCRQSNAQNIPSAGKLYRYQATVAPEDAIWLQMFASKLSTLSRVDSHAMAA
ncbi:MAG: hypothetical protein H0U74_14620 [Bradymonadaceae bacterium]|nr:hypothetical protein [Lujinxingiaceae bacterium]